MGGERGRTAPLSGGGVTPFVAIKGDGDRQGCQAAPLNNNNTNMNTDTNPMWLAFIDNLFEEEERKIVLEDGICIIAEPFVEIETTEGESEN